MGGGPGDTRRLDEIGKLFSVGDRTREMRGAATGRVHRRSMPERHRAGGTEVTTIREFGRIHALELALETPNELCVSRCLLAVWHAERVRLVVILRNEPR